MKIVNILFLLFQPYMSDLTVSGVEKSDLMAFILVKPSRNQP